MPDDTRSMQETEPQLSERVTYRIARAHARMNAQAARLLRETAGLSLTQWRVLVMLAREKAFTAADIVRFTQFDKGLVSRTVSRMTEEDLISQATSRTDGRATVLKITDKGWKAYHKARPAMLARQSRLMSSLTVAERAAFYASLDRLEAVMDVLDQEAP